MKHALPAIGCTAKSSRTGEPCKRWAIRGGRICPTHGGRSKHVKRAAAERLANLIDPKRALREAANLAYSDIRDLFNLDTGELLPMRQWPDGIAAAVQSIEVVKGNVDHRDGKQDTVYRIKLWDKPKALQMVWTHLGLLVEKQEHQGKIILSWRPRPQNTAPPGALPESGQRTLKDEMLAPAPGEADPFA